MLPALNTIAKQQSNPTQNTEAAITHFLYYAATNPFAIVKYKYIGMILHIDSDASYLSEPRACSRTGGHYYLRSLPANPEKYPNLQPPANGPIHTECRILKHVVASVAKAELGDCFKMGKQIYLSASHSKNSVSPNHQPQSKRITPQTKASPPLGLDKKGPIKGICSFIG